MKKIDYGSAFVKQHLSMFRCPVCHEPYTEMREHSLICAQGHLLDVNKKGSLYFLLRSVETEYNREMLAARRRMLTAGLFKPIVETVNEQLPTTAQTILDVGTGEGTPLQQLGEIRQIEDDVLIGFDLSKDGINLATQLTGDAFFCVADLTQLPFNDHQFDAIVELFSPSGYREFERVLKPGGRLVKVVPNSDYLVELRHALYDPEDSRYHYENDRVVELFMEHYPEAKRQTVQYQFPIGEEKIADMLTMTPLTWGADEPHRQDAANHPIQAVTVDVSVLTVSFP